MCGAGELGIDVISHQQIHNYHLYGVQRNAFCVLIVISLPVKQDKTMPVSYSYIPTSHMVIQSLILQMNRHTSSQIIVLSDLKPASYQLKVCSINVYTAAQSAIYYIFNIYTHIYMHVLYNYNKYESILSIKKKGG